jgi:hypothetical protein
MTDRKAVYDAIDGERAYQDARWTPETTSSGGQHSLEEWIVYMEDYLAEAKHFLSRESWNTGYPKALNTMRKVTAMGVAAMEQHGAPQR